jgi:hypothetical protein
MTSPGARQAQQNYQQQVQNNSATFRRNAAQHASRRGPMRPIRALLGLAFSLVFIAIAVGIFLMILNAAQPELLDQAKTWFDRTF